MPPAPAAPPQPDKAAIEKKKKETKATMANLFRGGLLMTVETSSQAVVAEQMGARGVVVLVDRTALVGDIAKETNTTADPAVVRSILGSVLIPVVGRVRLGHVIEAKVMQACGVDTIDEHEGPLDATADPMEKTFSAVPIIAGVKDLKDALKAIHEGASMLRTFYNAIDSKPEIEETVGVLKKIFEEIADLGGKTDAQLTEIGKPYKFTAAMLKELIKTKKFPVPLFADGGILQPTDVALVMGMHADGAIASSLIFTIPDPARRLHSMVMAAVYYKDPRKLLHYLEDS